MGMIVAAVFSLSFAVTAAVDPATLSPSGEMNVQQMSVQQKNAAMRPLVRSATDCIMLKIAANPHRQQSIRNGQLGELIVESMPSCLTEVRAMIDGHDHLFGEGSGEAFFKGPYLDQLPAAVTKMVGENVD